MKIIDKIFVRYKDEIAIIENSNLTKSKNLEKGIQLSWEYLYQFRELIRNQDFETKKEEIKFFKVQKPFVEGRLQFFKRTLKFIVSFPNSNAALKRKLINAEIEKLNYQKCEHQSFLRYYRTNQKKLDQVYFVRGITQYDIFLDFSDQRCS